MKKNSDTNDEPQDLAVYTLGFLQVPYIRRMLKAAGWQVRFGPFAHGAAAVGVWGRKPLARRGFAAAKRRALPVVSVEDAFLRSTFPGPATAPAGLIIDEVGIYFDASGPSELENILNGDGLNDPKLLQRAKDGIAFLQDNGLSKYNPEPRGDLPKSLADIGAFVLVIDQTAGDASIRCGQAGPETFATMLAAARAENPGMPIVIRTHPAVKSGKKTGHYSSKDTDALTILSTNSVNPWDLLARASSVYCVTSQFGFEAILAGHKPRVFGMPFYAGWGLSSDEQTCARRQKTITAQQLFAGAMLKYPHWVDPVNLRQCAFESAARFVEAKAKLAWAAQRPTITLSMSSWKIPQVSRFLSAHSTRPVFAKTTHDALKKAKETGARIVVWASKETPELTEACAAATAALWRMEDGFLRSSGLGAELTPADSVVLDDIGIYFDATRASRLERLIEASVDLPDYAVRRAKNLRLQVIAAGVTKYNIKANSVIIPPTDKTIILVPGQVEDDASIRLGCSDISTNIGLLKAARAANPDAFIIYKPHPDVEAGLRVGKIAAADIADMVVENASVPALLAQVDAVWTMTSLLGFEAVLRGVAVTCVGMPFYAGWGLTDDQGQTCKRRLARPSLDGLVHACLIDYPLYLDPVTKQATSPEGLVERLRLRQNSRGPRLRFIAKLQGKFARFAHLWR